ncbi:hypothetical protein FOLKNPGA_03633 [Legionella sp. PC1000]|nr:hypothetical protein FOLKNPGA_03633 [Legionella sp. PC1000]
MNPIVLKKHIFYVKEVQINKNREIFRFRNWKKIMNLYLIDNQFKIKNNQKNQNTI